MKFTGPIPGESLTRRPGSTPYEQPPQFNRVDEVFKYYLEALEEDDFIDDVLSVLDMGMPLDIFVDSMLVTNSAKGRHSVDMNFLIGPLIHEYLASVAEAAGVNLIEFQDDLVEKIDNASIERFKASFTDSLKDNEETTGLEDSLEASQEVLEGGSSFSKGEAPQEEQPPVETPPTGSPGLIGRPN